MSVPGSPSATRQPDGIARKNTSALIQPDDFEALFTSSELRQQLGNLAYPANATSVSIVPRQTRYQTSPVLPDGDLRSTYSRHVARVFSQDRSIVNLGRPSPVAISLGVASPTVSDKLRSLDESEFPVRLSSYETSREDEAKKNDVEAAHFTSNKEFFVPGRYQANTKDRTSLMRSAHLAQEPIVSLKPKTQEFGLLNFVDYILSPKDLSMQFGVVEPLFGTLSLWDASNGIKLTEDFSFNLNNDATLMGALGTSLRDVDPIWASKSFGLNIDASHRSSRIYLVLVVSKILVGDLDSTFEVYGKGKDTKDKDRTKFISENNELIRHLRSFRQQFAIAAVPLFKDDGSIAGVTSTSYDFKIDGFTRIKHLDIPDYLQEVLKADKKDKERKSNLPGVFSFQLRPYSVVASLGPIRNRVSQSLAKAEPTDPGSDVVREVANFVTPAFGNGAANVEGFTPASAASLAVPSAASTFSTANVPGTIPHHNLAAREHIAAASERETIPPLIVASAASLYPSHLLSAAEPLNVVYFMPSRLNVEGISSSGSKNICMEVKILAADSNPDAVGLAWLHGNSSYLSNSTLLTSARSSVWYHNKKPRFSDEFKFNVPISLSDKHHILVTFYHVNCKIKDKSTGGLGTAATFEEPIAYAAIPLVPRSSKDSTGANTSSHKLIRNGLYTISLVTKSNMPNNRYLDSDVFELWEQPLNANGFLPTSAAKIPFGSSALEFQIRVNSNVHSADPIIDEYLQTAGGLQSRAMETDAKACLEKFLARNVTTSLIFQQNPEGSAPAPAGGLNKSGSGSSVNVAAGYSAAANGPMSPHLLSVAAGASAWVDKTEILRFLPLLLTTHMSLIAHESRPVRQLAFVALLQTLVDAVEANAAVAPSIIQAYVDLIFDASIYPIGSSTTNASSTTTLSGANVSETKIHVILLQLWGGLNTQLSGLRDVAMRFSWVIAALVSKSATLQLAEDKRIPKSETGAPVKPNALGVPGTPPTTGLSPRSAAGGPPISPRNGAPIPFNENRSKWFPKLFYDALSDFLSSAAAATRHYHASSSLSTIVAHRFTVHLANFVSDLYAIVDRGQLNKLVVTYLDKMVNFVVDDNGVASSQTPAASNNLIVSRCLFFKVLSQHPNFYSWNVPEMQDFKTGGEMLRKWQARHVLITSLLDTFKMAFHPLSSEQSRDLVLDTLIDMMYRLDSREDLNDEESFFHPKKKGSSATDDSAGVNYISNAPTDAASATSKSKIAGMFLPYVYFLIDKLEYFESAAVSTRERNKALLPFLWVLKHAPYEILAKYWERDSEKRIFALLKLCSYAATAFELAPEKLIRVKREVNLPSNPIFSLNTELFPGEEPRRRSGSVGFSGTGSMSGSMSSASGVAAAALSGDFDPSASPNGDPDAMGLLSSGMRSLQVPGAGGTTSKKKGRGRLPSDTIPVVGGSIGVSGGNGLMSSSSSQSVHSSPVRKKDKVDVDIEVRREMNFAREVSLILVDTLVAFSNTFPKALKRRDTFEQLWTPLLNAMGSKWTICAMRSIFEAVYHLLPAFKVHFFAKQNSACSELIYNTLRACTAPQFVIRSSALAVLSRLVQANFICTSNIDRFRLQATIAIIKIVGSGSASAAGPSPAGPMISTNLKPAPGSHGAIPFNTTAPAATLDFSKLNASLAHVSKELLQDDAKALLTPSASVLAINAAPSPRPGPAATGTPRSPHYSAGTLSPAELASKKGAVVKGLEELQLKVQRILDDVRKMKHYEYDTETLVDLYYGMSRNLEDSPDERIVWLENLAEMHRAQGNLEECAQAKILLAALAGAYLRILNRWDLSQKIVPAFHLVAPNIRAGEDTSSAGDVSPRSIDHSGGRNNPANVSREYHESLRSVKDEVCQSAIFSAKGFSTLLSEAIQLLKEGGFYESCAAAYRMILPTYYENDNYAMQKRCYAELQWLCQQILDENVMKQRIFSNYYRVVVYGGSKVGLGAEVNGVEFVYKEQPTVRLMDFTEKLKRKYELKFGGEGSVVVLPNSQVVKVSELDPNKIFMQICNVDIYWSPAELLERNTGFKQQFGAQRFVMEQPFVKPKAGASKESAQASAFEDQHIRRTIFTTFEAFPHLLKRSKVISKEEVELTPIECAIALIEKRSRALKAELSSSSPNMKNIQRELQGAVLTQVNAGPLAVIQTFLADDKASKYTSSPSPQGAFANGGKIQSHREILADCVSEFERSVAFGLALNKAMIAGDVGDVGAATTQESSTQQTLQEELAKGLDRLRAAMSACSIFASRKDAKNQLDEEQRRQEAERAHRTLGDENGPSTFIGTPRGTPRSASAAPAPASFKQPTAKVTMIKKPDVSPRGSPTSAVSTAPIPAPITPPEVALPPPIDSPTGKSPRTPKTPKDKEKEKEKKSKDKKDKEKEKDKDKEKRKIKKSATEVPTTTTAATLNASPSAGNVPAIKIPPPIDASATPTIVSATSTAPSTPTAHNTTDPTTPKAAEPPLTPTSAAAASSSGPSPRARAVSAAAQRAATKTQAERDREREEREKERLAELKAKAKKTEVTRVASSIDPASIAAANAAASSSVAAAPIPAPVDSRKALIARVEHLVTDLLGKAAVIQHGIPEASEPPELASIIKSLKAFKEALISVVAAFPSPPNPPLNAAPAPSGADKLAHYKAVCNNEVENIKITLNAIRKDAPVVQPTASLNGIVGELEKVGSHTV